VSDAPSDPREPILETQVAAPAAPALPANPAVPAPAASAPVPDGARLTAGAVLSRTLRAWWAHLGAFSAMSFVVFAPMLAGFGLFSWSVLSPAAGGTQPEAAAFVRGGFVVFAAMAATLALSVVQMGAVTYGTIRWLHGERAPVRRMIAVGLGRGLPVAGTGFLLWLAAAAGTLLLVVPGVMLLIAGCVAIPAAVVERPGVTGAIGRSFELTRGFRWPLFGAGLALLGVQWLLSALLQVVALALMTALPPAWALGGGLLASQLGNVLFAVVPSIAVAVCYHDLRRAKEGVDTAELARVFE
jgi:hypothetical protein